MKTSQRIDLNNRIARCRSPALERRSSLRRAVCVDRAENSRLHDGGRKGGAACLTTRTGLFTIGREQAILLPAAATENRRLLRSRESDRPAVRRKPELGINDRLTSRYVLHNLVVTHRSVPTGVITTRRNTARLPPTPSSVSPRDESFSKRNVANETPDRKIMQHCICNYDSVI